MRPKYNIIAIAMLVVIMNFIPGTIGGSPLASQIILFVLTGLILILSYKTVMGHEKD